MMVWFRNFISVFAGDKKRGRGVCWVPSVRRFLAGHCLRGPFLRTRPFDDRLLRPDAEEVAFP